MSAATPLLPNGPDAEDELGAHVSTAGGVWNAPERARALDSGVLQLFTKQPNRWAEPEVDEESAERFRRACEEHRIRVTAAHDSYLINLASPDPRLRAMSRRSFAAELARCAALDLDLLVTHPGNATDGALEEGIERNAEEIARCLEEVPGRTRVLLELTAGGGTTVGGRFEHLAAILDAVPEPLRARVGVCVDTCHAYSAGYDLVGDYDGVWDAFDRVIGLGRLGLLHLNDSKHPFASRRDRHENIGAGTLGFEPFRRIVTDPRLAAVPKVIETPKGDDPVAADRGNLGVLRGFRRG